MMTISVGPQILATPDTPGRGLPNFQAADLNLDFHRACHRSSCGTDSCYVKFWRAMSRPRPRENRSLARNSLFGLVLRTASIASGQGISDEPRISPNTRIRVASRIHVIGEIRGFVLLHRSACLRRAAKSEKCLPNFQTADLNCDCHRACHRSIWCRASEASTPTLVSFPRMPKPLSRCASDLLIH